MGLSALALAGGLGLDLLAGEPPDWAHPVAWFGRAVDAIDRAWRRPRLVGVVAAIGLPLLAAAVVGGGTAAVSAWNWGAGVALGAVVVFVTTSLRALLETVRRVNRLASSDLPAAREALVALVGRDAAGFDAAQVRSAAVESLAENLADGLVAPLSAFALAAGAADLAGVGGPATLALACASAGWIKGVNTMDSMVGYRDRPFGYGAARLDDVAMYLPARIAAVLVAAAFLRPSSLARAAGWVDRVHSPNSGWPMGTVAAALDVRLEKPGSYVLNPDAPSPTAADVDRALVRVGTAGLVAYGLAGVVAWS